MPVQLLSGWPDMQNTTPLASLLARLGLTQGQLFRGVGLSRSVASRIVCHDEWPRRAEIRNREAIAAWLHTQGASEQDVAFLKRVGPDRANDPTPVSPEEADFNNEGAEMLLDPQTLSQRARELYGLRRNPFEPDLEGADDVFLTVNLRERLLDMESAVLNRRFVAIFGESGSGKTTLRLLLQSRIADKAVVVRPLTTIGMAENDRKGQTLRIDDIYHAIVDSIDPTEPIKRKREARARQIGAMVSEVGKPVCIVIEEAHRMPLVTLQSLKSLRENDNDFEPSLGVLLIGHQELDTLLSKNQVREVGQRALRCEMPPLTRAELHAYMAHRFSRVGADLDKVFEPAAIDAIAAHLMSEQVKRVGGVESKVKVNQAYPLHVGNTAVSLMNFAAGLSVPKICMQTAHEKWPQIGKKGV